MGTVTLKNIEKAYNDVTVVHGIDLEIKDKEFVVLVGPSGCGKSTTLRMIAGLEEITGGELLIDQKVVNETIPSKRGVSMVFQDYALYPHMTVFDNLAFSLKLKRTPKSEIEERVQVAAKMLDLTEYLGRKPAALSGGQRQRVAMGRAIVKKSSVFLFDEPLSNLDAKLRSKMRIEIKRFHLNTKTTTIYVTHDQLEAMTLADRLVVMKDGIIEQIGSPMEVFERPRSVFVATFIGNPGMNLFDVKIKNRDEEVYIEGPNNIFSFKLPPSKANLIKENTELIMGIRPSDIFIPTKEEIKKAEWKVKGKVEMVELLGKNAFLTMKIDDIECTSEIMGRIVPEIEEELFLNFNLHHAHFFDPKTKINIEC